MLNIKDIEERLKRNPEPSFVKDVRDNIINSFEKLKFYEEGHVYTLEKEDGTIEQLPSVSKICHRFQKKVDWDAIAEKKAERLNIPLEQLLREWKEKNLTSTSNGTKTHLFGEAYMYFFRGKPEMMPKEIYDTQYEEGYLIPYTKKEEAIASFYEELMKVDNVYPVMAEAKIYTGINDTLKLSQNYSGTFDMLFAYNVNGKWQLGIFDWKTNKSLISDWNRDHGEMLLPPFGNMFDESLSIYTLQLSAYQLGIEQLGYEVPVRRIVWLKEDGTFEKISVSNVTKQLKEVL